ncbi:hypothetical protein HZS_810 [Henneguya salminicola]|nr:hypothetical protein HZS_810 [Henneguya salminicola]
MGLDCVKLKNIRSDRLVSLGTQMKWRMQEGNGEAYYQIGVTDFGNPVGIEITDLNESIENILKICKMIDSTVSRVRILHTACIVDELTRYVCEIKIEFPMPPDFNAENKRVFLLGTHHVGKTSLIGVLSKGIPDDGQGHSRTGLSNHLHEIKSGHTSSLSYNLMGFTKEGEFLNYLNCKNKVEVCNRSHISITFIDSCGLKKFFDTTINGLACHFPHSIFLLINPQHTLCSLFSLLP